jgi:uncharacterized YccA/Bax inhibitor family protein
MGHESQVTSHGLKARVFGVLVFMLGSSALADHVPPAGLDSKGTWAVLISVGVIFSLLILSFAWAYLDGQFTNPERIKYSLTEPEREWPFENGTSLERPVVPSKS